MKGDLLEDQVKRWCNNKKKITRIGRLDRLGEEKCFYGEWNGGTSASY